MKLKIYTLKQWIKPELTIFVRNHPEERILSYCKGNVTELGNQEYHEGCGLYGDEYGCTLCEIENWS